MFLRMLILALGLGTAGWSAGESIPSVRLRVRTFARESAAITNPIAWALFTQQVPEGSRVQKGDVVFTIDLQGTRDRIDRLENRLEVAENQAAQQLATMRTTLRDLHDRRDELVDSRAVRKARLTYLLSMPRAADVDIARGRLNVARERLAAETDNLDTMRKRLENNLIAPVRVEEAERAAALQEARARHAERMLELARIPAHPDEVKIVELRIENLNLEIAKIEKEIPTQERILGIEQDSRNRQVETIRRELNERQEELAYETLRAPADGILLFSPQLKRELTTGGRASKGMVVAEIPETGHMALEGVIPEQTRHLFEVGDPATVRLNLYPGRVFKARLLSISPFSRDAREEEDASSGVKLVDVELELENPPDPLPLGVYGWANLSAGDPIQGESVPVSWVRYRGGKPHLSVEGRYRPVDGILHGARFTLTPPHPPSSSLQPEGRWPESAASPNLEVGNRFTASGELQPLESVSVEIPRIRAWDMKITWLHPEKTRVEAGEEVARLDSEMMRDRVQRREEEAETRRGEREATEEQFHITRNQRDFQVASASNKLEIARLNRDLVLSGGNGSAIARAELDETTARIQLEAAKAELERGARHPDLTAPAELRRREREVERRRYQMEKARLAKAEAKEGATDLERSEARLDVLRAEKDLADVEARFHRDLSRLQSQLQWRLRRERQNQERLEREQEQLDQLTITAPVSGLVKYEKIWDGVRSSKSRPGMRVFPGHRLLSLSNTSEVYVEVPLPERYVHRLSTGMPVQVVIPSEGNLQWRGTVTKFGEMLEPSRPDARPGSLYANQEATREQVLPVRVVVEPSERGSLKPGAIAQLIFPFDQ